MWFSKDPRFVWAFWKFRHDLYTNASIHDGYHILKRWGESKPLGMFSFTSNVDGFWPAMDVPTYECHGSINYLQCRTPCDGNLIWPTPPSDISTLKFDEGVDDTVSGHLPKCIKCNGLARPNVLMFNDWHYVGVRNDEQYDKYVEFLDSTENKRVCLEIGAGSAVPTVRSAITRAFSTGGTGFIRIGFDFDTTGEVDESTDKINIKMGAKDALQAIDAAMKE